MNFQTTQPMPTHMEQLTASANTQGHGEEKRNTGTPATGP
jgi:hypothetical protein